MYATIAYIKTYYSKYTKKRKRQRETQLVIIAIRWELPIRDSDVKKYRSEKGEIAL